VTVAQQLGKTPFEQLVLVAQHFHLPLLQRHRGFAVRIAEPDRGQQFGVLGEEIGIGEQIVGDFAIVHGLGLGEARRAARRSIG
jgi:hypothetical protein